MSQMSVTPKKTAPKDAEAVNHRLLVQAGFIHQEMAGAYTYLSLGWRVLNKIENIVREEMDKIGEEILMTSLAPTQLWKQTGRLETVDVLMKTVPANVLAAAKNDAEYVLSPTHEEMVTPIVADMNVSYKNLPKAVYQIQTKFRNEPRAKNGLLRCREFRMKDLYSFHVSEESLKEYYEKTKEVYMTVYERLGLKDSTYLTLASGGDFTKDYSHEFQVRVDAGEDTIYLNKETGVAYNKEVAPEDAEDTSKYEVFKACEVGNIFPLNTKFSEAFDYYFTDQNGERKIVYMGSYGIGTSRLIAVLVEKFNDERGIIWPKSVAPYTVHLVTLDNKLEESEKIYKTLNSEGIDVLWDDRDLPAGGKFADADLIGCPFRVLVSERSLLAGGVELKMRNETGSKMTTMEELLTAINA